MSANGRLTKAEREALIERVAQLEREGYTQREIAERTGLAQQTVSKYSKVILERYAGATLDRDSLRGRIASYYWDVYREARMAWERSKLDARKVVVTEDENGPEGRGKRVQRTREGRLPSNAYLQTMAECLEAIRQLVGLDAVQEMDVRHHVFDWVEFNRALREDGKPAQLVEVQRVAPELLGNGEGENPT